MWLVKLAKQGEENDQSSPKCEQKLGKLLKIKVKNGLKSTTLSKKLKKANKMFFPKADNKFGRKFSRTEFGAVGCAAFSTSAWKGIRHSGWKFSLLVGTGWRYFIFYVPCLHRADSVGEAGQIFHFWVHTYIWKDIPKLGTLPNVSMLLMLSYPNIEVKGPLHNSKWNMQEMKQQWLLKPLTFTFTFEMFKWP